MKSIAIVQHNPFMRALFADFFLEKGWQVHETSWLDKAALPLQERQFDAILFDVLNALDQTPGAGNERLKFLQATFPTSQFFALLPVPHVEATIELMRRGAHSVFSRSDDPEKLVEKIIQSIPDRAPIRSEIVGDSLLVSKSSVLKTLLNQAELFKGFHDYPVLIVGETGTGKEMLVEHLIQRVFTRSSKKVIKVNCGAIPESLLESEIFGHESGAFTGAKGRHSGIFEAAHGGTLFLDEISSMPAYFQTALLRILEEKKVRRIGGNESINVDVQIIAATNVDLEQLVRQKMFREDLLHRLQGFILKLPPLRERGDDIVELTLHFLTVLGARLGMSPPTLTAEIRKWLAHQPWPGNVRQLKNTVLRAFVSAQREPLTLQHFIAASEHAGLSTPVGPALPTLADAELNFDGIKKEVFQKVLERFGGNKSRAADALGISRKTLERALKKP